MTEVSLCISAKGPTRQHEGEAEILDGLAVNQNLLSAPATAGLPDSVRSRQHLQRLPQLGVKAPHIEQVNGPPQCRPAASVSPSFDPWAAS